MAWSFDDILGKAESIGNDILTIRAQNSQNQIARAQAQATLVQAQTAAAAQAAADSNTAKIAKFAMFGGAAFLIIAMFAEGRKIWRSR